jgi:predicted metalloprotease
MGATTVTRTRLRAAVIAVFALVLVVAGSGTASGQTPPTPAEVASDIQTAVLVTDAFWAQNMQGYTSPTVVGLYDGTRPGAPTCGAETLGPQNAYYCRPGDYVAWDVTLMGRAFELGDAFLYYVVAHEWGHAVQARLSAEHQSIAGELQADCLAGGALYGAAAAGLLVFEQGDEKEIVNGLTNVADEFAWGDPSHHGNAFQRIEAFNKGRTGGVTACIPGLQ